MTPTEELTNEHRIILRVSDERKREVDTAARARNEGFLPGDGCVRRRT